MERSLTSLSSLCWFFPSSYTQTYSPPSSTTMDKRGATVTRELFVTELGEDDSGLVECLVLQDDDEEDGLVVMSSSASLSVLRELEKREEERGERK